MLASALLCEMLLQTAAKQPQKHIVQATRRLVSGHGTCRAHALRWLRPSASSAPQPSAARAQASQNCVTVCCCLLLVLCLPSLKPLSSAVSPAVRAAVGCCSCHYCCVCSCHCSPCVVCFLPLQHCATVTVACCARCCSACTLAVSVSATVACCCACRGNTHVCSHTHQSPNLLLPPALSSVVLVVSAAAPATVAVLALATVAFVCCACCPCHCSPALCAAAVFCHCLLCMRAAPATIACCVC